MSGAYSGEFYSRQFGGSAASSKIVVPQILARFPVTSVVDIGCGTGIWLNEFHSHGVDDYLGIDGAYVPEHVRKIPAEHFKSADLRQLTKLERTFDLACSLEVAEHLPPENASAFVQLLAKAAPIVLFSAAVPHQGGTEHINEQSASYWARLFIAHGKQPYDCVRPLIWNNAQVEWWYRQNIVVYASPQSMPAAMTPVADISTLDYIHPEMLTQVMHRYENFGGGLKILFNSLKAVGASALRSR
ncbi:hypothetical protein MHY1_02832 [Methylovirgula sp. HY1]|nr:hypothetical protein MHY1_02832 [Methylovirgula sp. HY1]